MYYNYDAGTTQTRGLATTTARLRPNRPSDRIKVFGGRDRGSIDGRGRSRDGRRSCRPSSPSLRRPRRPRPAQCSACATIGPWLASATGSAATDTVAALLPRLRVGMRDLTRHIFLADATHVAEAADVASTVEGLAVGRHLALGDGRARRRRLLRRHGRAEVVCDRQPVGRAGSAARRRCRIGATLQLILSPPAAYAEEERCTERCER